MCGSVSVSVSESVSVPVFVSVSVSVAVPVSELGAKDIAVQSEEKRERGPRIIGRNHCGNSERI